ncbi:hypothetical protein [Paracidobacterium acidisoli]|uniref:hypothetical protein n=1 Tax=Paracidobacterium acidisoli TaxID=2303751 RepID=UPI0011C1BAC7|nr:hypothetical protein [Paracidobacterium acidisoli]MBT9331974.1 hypothetical protein [Paracidobacterium acidisoli]
MARATRKSRIEASSLAATESASPIDALVKDLIDELIVPMLIEEFLRQYGPASKAKKDSSTGEFQPDTELNSTP